MKGKQHYSHSRQETSLLKPADICPNCRRLKDSLLDLYLEVESKVSDIVSNDWLRHERERLK